MSIRRPLTNFPRCSDIVSLSHGRFRTRLPAALLLATLPALTLLLGDGSNAGFAQQQSAATVTPGVPQFPSQPVESSRGTDRAVIVRGGGFVQPASAPTPDRGNRSREGQAPAANPILPVAARQPGAVDPPAANRAPLAPAQGDLWIVHRLEPPLPPGVDHLLAYTLPPIKIEIAAPPLPTEQELANDPTINPFAYIDADELKVKLEGQFDARPIGVSLQRLTHVVFPRDRSCEEISSAGLFTAYEIQENWPEPVRTVRIRNRFGEEELTLGRPKQLLVPAGLDGGSTAGFDHYKCFVVLRSCQKRRVHCVAPYETELPAAMAVGGAVMFCVPVTKLHDGTLAEIADPETHLTFYSVISTDAPRSLEVQDQFRKYDLQQGKKVMVGVPTYKLSVFPPVPRRVAPAPQDENQASRAGTPQGATSSLGGAALLGLTRIHQYFATWGDRSR